jgi:hypothetical protein
MRIYGPLPRAGKGGPQRLLVVGVDILTLTGVEQAEGKKTWLQDWYVAYCPCLSAIVIIADPLIHAQLFCRGCRMCPNV